MRTLTLNIPDNIELDDKEIFIILKAKQKGIINSVKPILNKLKQTNFRLNEKLERDIINESGE